MGLRVLVALFSVVALFTGGWWYRHQAREAKIDRLFVGAAANAIAEDKAIWKRIDQAQQPSYLVLGDSNTALATLRPVDGLLPVNAGIGGASVATFQNRARDYVSRLRPAAVVIALGLNDSYYARDAQFAADYGSLLDSLSGQPIAVLLIPQVEMGKPSTKYHPGPAVIDRFNAAIRAQAAQRGVSVTELPSLATADGIHIARAAYPRWREAVEAAVRKLAPYRLDRTAR